MSRNAPFLNSQDDTSSVQSSPPPYSPVLINSGGPPSDSEPSNPEAQSLHPRVAVLLGVNSHWHKWLFFCRLLAVAPELRFGIPLLWTVVKRLLILRGGSNTLDAMSSVAFRRKLTAVELILAPLWVCFTLPC